MGVMTASIGMGFIMTVGFFKKTLLLRSKLTNKLILRYLCHLNRFSFEDKVKLFNGYWVLTDIDIDLLGISLIGKRFYFQSYHFFLLFEHDVP
jgi:hypothetical protein